jgi:hypothetical protein
MKSFVALVIALSFTPAICKGADAPPPVSARQAVAIAEESLANRGLEKEIYIQSVTLERATILKARSFWFVKWSHSLPASNPKNREIGVKVNMDGSAVRLVKEPGA